MRGKRNTDRNVRKFITVSDEDKWEMIDKLMTLPRYEKSFNKTINAALDFGLPELVKSEFSPAEKDDEKDRNESGGERGKELTQEEREFYTVIVRTLGEIVLNANLNKAMLSSLSEVMRKLLRGERVSGTAFEKGYFQDTPAYLESYELQELKRLEEE